MPYQPSERKKTRAQYQYKGITKRVLANPPAKWAEPCTAPPVIGSSTWDTVPEAPKAEADLKREEQDRLNLALAGWPWSGDRFMENITLAPYSFNNYKYPAPFSQPEAKQKSRLLELLQIAPIRSNIINLLFRNHRTAYVFSSTSRMSALLVAYEAIIWDLDAGFYNQCESSRSILDAASDGGLQPSVASIVIITPVRSPEGRPNYSQQVDNLHKLCLASSNFAEYLRNVQFHRVPFLTTQILALLVPKMRKLKVLGVYKCQLIHIGHGMQLLDILQRDKPPGHEYQVYLDWFPNFHIGPDPEKVGKYYTGAYGFTWDDPEIDTRLGAWKLVFEIIQQAKIQNIDMTTLTCAFRQFLDLSPLWKVAETLKVMTESKFSAEDYVAHVNYPELEGDVDKIYERNIQNKPEGRAWMIDSFTCEVCTKTIPGIHFRHKQIRDSRIYGNSLVCLGCELTDYLDEETDHFKEAKRAIMKAWLYSDERGCWNDNDLPKAIADFTRYKIVEEATGLDFYRGPHLHHMASGCLKRCDRDHEYEEYQRPFRMEYATSFRGAHGRQAPTIADKDGTFEALGQWNWFNRNRIYAAGAV